MPGVERLFQGVEYDACMGSPRCPPANDAAGGGVDDEGHAALADLAWCGDDAAMKALAGVSEPTEKERR
jgi:hypothetical protein